MTNWAYRAVMLRSLENRTPSLRGSLVGVPGFEPGTSRTRSVLAVLAIQGYMVADRAEPYAPGGAIMWGYIITNPGWFKSLKNRFTLPNNLLLKIVN